MTSTSSFMRRSLWLAMVAILLASTGCGWLRGRSGYENSPESRPLEVPPDLDMPTADPSMQIPQTPGASRAAAPATGFLVSAPLAAAWRRVGDALEAMDGVSIESRAELLSVYNVSFEGESFLVKLVAEGDSSRVSAVDTAGQALASGPATRLMAQLRERLD